MIGRSSCNTLLDDSECGGTAPNKRNNDVGMKNYVRKASLNASAHMNESIYNSLQRCVVTRHVMLSIYIYG